MVDVKPGMGREPVKAPEPLAKGNAKDAELVALKADQPDASLFDRAKLKAPNLTPEFVSSYKLDDDYLERVARGEEPPPPYIPENDVTELHYLGGSWSITAKGDKP
jgi:hypothetical protein